MNKIEQNRQRDQRFDIGSRPGSVEFGHPDGSGQRVQGPLHEISIAGLSFLLHEEQCRLDSGATILDAVVRVGGERVLGAFLIKHVTEHLPGQVLCGAIFYPADHRELGRLEDLVAGLARA